MKVRIEKIGINGEGIGYDNKKPVFIPQALIGEECDIDITEKNRTYERGKIKTIIKKSESRVKPYCALQHRCGACTLMIADYKKQLEYKRDLLKQSLIKYAQINPKLIAPVMENPNPLHYRNQCKLPLSMEEHELVSGMYIPGSNYFLRVDDCPIHEQGLENIRKQVLKVLNAYEMRAYDYHQKRGIRTLVIRGFHDQYQVTLVSGDQPLSSDMIEELMKIEGIISLWQSINTVKKSPDIFGQKMILLAGERYLPLQLDHLQLHVSPRSFFQLNTIQASNLYQCVRDMVGDGNERIVEAYSGIGAISLYLKDKANEIIGIESIKDAVVNANANAQLNGCDNVKFLCADAADKLTYISKKQKIDVLIVDPPRTGLDDNMLSCILKSKIKDIIYISCNPATLGKNLAILKDRYEVKKIQPIDMFSQTAHVESVVLMSRKNK